MVAIELSSKLTKDQSSLELCKGFCNLTLPKIGNFRRDLRLSFLIGPEYADRGHRITTNAATELMEHYGKEGSEEGEGFIAFILCELLPLVPFAVRKWESGGILETDFDFRVGKSGGRNRLWFIPNERGGITVMKPEDY